MKYRLLALDVDGTLIGPCGQVPAGVIEAIGRANRAGLKVVLATGRSYIETIGVWRQLGLCLPGHPIVLVGGALVSETDTARTLWHQPIPKDLAQSFAEALAEHGYCAMGILDSWRCGLEYVLFDLADSKSAPREWFSRMDVSVRTLRRLDEAPELPSPLRLSTVVEPGKASELAGELSRRFAGKLRIHPIFAPNYGLTIVEAFAARTDKLSAVSYVAQGWRIPMSAVVAVGDDINDVSMLSSAGFGVAMAHGSACALDSAKHVTADLAGLIGDILEGRLG